MTLLRNLTGTTPVSGDAPNVADVFSTYLYDGTGASLTITNGIDLDGEGGMVWTKSRYSGTANHFLYDTERGINKFISSNVTGDEQSTANTLTSFNSDGFTLGGSDYSNIFVGEGGVSWTFRKAPRFFDVVTYTGDGVAGREIAHNLGCAVGMMLVKVTNISDNWAVYHRSTTADYWLQLNTTSAAIFSDSAREWDLTEPTDTVFTVGYDDVTNASGNSYVAYIFAHDPDGEDDDGMIACGSYTGNGNSSGQHISLGWEPQWVLVKESNSSGNHWEIIDSMRGAVTGDEDARLFPNTSSWEAFSNVIEFNADGFKVPNQYNHNNSGSVMVYMAIRAPMMKEPEAGTEVFLSQVATPSSGVSTITTSFPVDAVLSAQRSKAGYDDTFMFDRMRGESKKLVTNKTDIEGTTSSDVEFDHSGQLVNRFLYVSTSAVHWMFKRAKGFFDVVAYTGTGSAHTENHSLGVAPEMIWVKRRPSNSGWIVYSATLTATKLLVLNSTAAKADAPTAIWNGTEPTSTTFSVGIDTDVNANNKALITYLFATLAGVSKVGNYTGNGSNQNIACGFSAGARFVLIKRTDSSGDWYTWDTERGIVTGNDPHLSLNSTSAEVTNDDSIDPQSAGFTVNQVSATNINVTSATYIFLAIA